jgi:hypothetical protein
MALELPIEGRCDSVVEIMGAIAGAFLISASNLEPTFHTFASYVGFRFLWAIKKRTARTATAAISRVLQAIAGQNRHRQPSRSG